MPVKIRLQRHGKKGKPFYWVVAADARSKRDGRYLEKLGTYNPNTNPATVNLKFDDIVSWLNKGAQPTDTARTLLSYKGIMLKHHLNGGVRKGALTQEVADKKLATWLEEKEAKVQAKKDGLSKGEADVKSKRLAEEKEISEKRLADATAAEVEEAAPVKEEEVAPVKEEEAAPVKEEEVAPVKEEEVAPVKEEEAAPVKEEEVAPVKEEEAAPVKEEAPSNKASKEK